MSAPYLVVWSYWSKGGDLMDAYVSFDTYPEAMAKYNALQLDEHLYCAHIVRPIRSTDYECVPNYEELKC